MAVNPKVANLALLLVSTVLALLAAEAVLRVWEGARLGSGQAQIVPLDRLNYNNEQVTVKKAAGEFRVLSFGDSFAFSIVRPQYTYHQVAAAHLTSSAGPVSVVNLGEPAISFPQYEQAHQQWGRVLEYDAAIFNIYVGNDIIDVAYGFVPEDADPHHALAGLEGSAESGGGQQASGDLATILSRVNFVPQKFPLRLLDYGYALYLSQREVLSQQDLDLDPAIYTRAVLPLSPSQYLEVAANVLHNFRADKLAAHRKGYDRAAGLARYLQHVARSGKPVIVLLSPPQLAVDPTLRQRIRAQLPPAEFDPDMPFVLLEQIFQSQAPDVSVLSLDHLMRCAIAAGQAPYIERDTHWSQTGNRLTGTALAMAMGKSMNLTLSSQQALPCEVLGPRRAPNAAESAFLATLGNAP